MRGLLLSLFTLFALMMLGACAKKATMYEDYGYAMAESAPPPPPAPPADMDDSFGGATSLSPGVAMERSYQTAETTVATTRSTTTKGGRGRSEASGASASPTSSPRPAPAAQAPEKPLAEDPKPAARMIHYNGYAKLQATKTAELLDQVVKLAESMGGFVEQLGSSRVTVRVPVERFDDTMKQVLELADVLDRAITAEDVTDAFLAVDLRLATARTTRDRLVVLLAQAKDEREKLSILAQIRRLSEEIDVMEGQIRTLSALASMSRVTVEVVARPAFASQAPGQDPVGFGWIHRLSPFRRDVALSGDLSKMEVPTGFVPLDVKKRFIAESADGAVIWTTKLENDPKGDASFWVRAIRERMAPEFASADVSTVGTYELIRFVSETDDPYRYMVGVRVVGDDLYLVEVYFPNETVEARYKDAVLKVIGGGQS